MLKRQLFLIAVILMLFPVLAFAATELSGGTCGESLTWALDSDGVLTISGSGEMYDYYTGNPYMGASDYLQYEYEMSHWYNAAPWRYDYEDQIRRVVVQSGVTWIGEEAFANCDSLTEISLAGSVTGIGQYAFAYCGAITEIEIPGTVLEIGMESFEGCSSLSRISLGEGVRSIGYSAFQSTGITEFVFPDSVTSAGGSLFSGCSSLKSVRLGSGIKTLSYSFFGTCSALETVFLPSTISSLSGETFQGCTKLKTLVLAEGNQTYRVLDGILFTEDGKHLIYAPPGLALEEYAVPSGVTEIGVNAFYRFQTLKFVALPDGLKTIGDSAFYAAPLTGVTLPASLTEIGSYAFYRTSLTGLTLPESLTKIGSSAFAYTNLTDLTIPGNVSAIGSSAFSNCTKLETVTLEAGERVFGTSVFSACQALTSVVLGECLETVTSNTFYNCSALAEIALPLSLRSIGSSAFQGCGALTHVQYPGTYADWTAIQVAGDNDPLTSVMLKRFGAVSGTWKGFEWRLMEGTLTVTGSGPLPNAASSALPPWCVYASSINLAMLDDGITELGNYTFRGCVNMAEIHFPLNLVRIGENTFYNCKMLTGAMLPDSVLSLGNGAFYNAGLRSIVLPSGITAIPNNCFNGCKSLYNITIPETVLSIGDSAFEECGLTRIHLPASVRSLGRKAFWYASSLKGIVIPSDVDELKEMTFFGCGALRTVTIPTSVTTVAWDAFEGCDDLTDVYYAGTEAEFRCIQYSGDTYGMDYPYDPWMTPFGNATIHYEHTALAGTCGNELDWTLDAEGVLTISGTGFMWDYAEGGAPWAEFAEDIREIVLSEGITRIGDYAFSHCAGVEQIQLPESLNAIGEGAFQGCNGLTDLIYIGTVSEWSQVSIGSEAVSEGVRVICAIPERISDLTVARGESGLVLSWTKAKEEETTGYRVYRRAEDAVNFTRAVQISGPEQASWTDESAEADKLYFYYVVGVSSLGYEGAVSNFVSGTMDEPHTHTWGEWIIDTVPAVYREGHQHRECIECGERENETLPRLEMTEELAERYGDAAFRVVDAASGSPIAGASLLVKLSEDETLTLMTDEDGKAREYLPVGDLRVTAYAAGRLARNLTVKITGGMCEIPEIGLSATDLLDAEIVVTEMTYEEIVAAGIDAEAEGNQQIFQYNVQIEFSPEIEVLNMDYMVNLDGNLLGWNLESDHDSGEPGWKPVKEENDSDDRPVPVRYDPGPSSETEPITVFPVTEQFYLVVYGETRWVKEMFDVEMLVINRSLTDTLEDCTVSLQLPEGLSLAELTAGGQQATVRLGTVAEGRTKSTHWYVRGDKEGDYGLTAALSATMMPFGEKVERTYTTEQYMHVFAGSALHMTYELPDAAYYGEDYKILAEIENVSDRTLYNVTGLISRTHAYRITHQRGASVLDAEYIDQGGQPASGFAREFRPGDKLIMEISVPIGFESAVSEEILEDTREVLARMSEIHNTMVTIKNIAGIVNAIKDLMKSLGRGIMSTFARFSILDNYCAFLDASSDLLTGDAFDAFGSLERVMEMVPVRYSLVARQLNVMEGSTTEIPTTFRTKKIARKLVISEPAKYRAAMMSVLLGNFLKPPDTGIFPFDDLMKDTLRETFAYDEAIQYLQAVENQSQTFRFFVPGKSEFNLGDAETTVTIWSEKGTLGLEAVGESGRQQEGRLLIDGSCMVRVTPGAVDDTLYFMADGETRTVEMKVIPAHTCAGAWQIVGYATEETDGLEIMMCETCGEIMDIRITHSCGEHDFTEYETEAAPTETEPGIQTRVCKTCHVLDWRFVDENGTEIPMKPEFSLSAGRLDLQPGEKAQLFTILPDGFDPGEWTWESENPAVATVQNDGTVTLLQPGETVISVRAANGNGLAAKCAVRTDNLPRVKLPAGLNVIGPEAMAGNESLRCVDLTGTAAPAIGERAFVDCLYLVKILLPEGTELGADAFSGCPEAVCYCPDQETADAVKAIGLSFVLVSE